MLICIQSIRGETDRNTIEELFCRYGNTMLYTAQGILKDRALAEDAVSQAFVKIINSLQKFTFESSNKTKGLLVILVRNISFDMLKKQKSENLVSMDDYEENFEDAEDTTLDQTVSEESCRMIMDCLLSLDAKWKDVLRLKLLYGYSDDEAAKILSITPGNARVRFHRARKLLIKEMKKRGNGDES